MHSHLARRSRSRHPGLSGSCSAPVRRGCRRVWCAHVTGPLTLHERLGAERHPRFVEPDVDPLTSTRAGTMTQRGEDRCAPGDELQRRSLRSGSWPNHLRMARPAEGGDDAEHEHPFEGSFSVLGESLGQLVGQ